MKLYQIEPDLSDEKVAYIDDWEFTHWPKPESEIIKNEDGSFSVSLESNFVPLVRQLQNLFSSEEVPSEGTYLGEAVLIGSNTPKDLIEGDFINSRRGLFMSKKLLGTFRDHKLPKNLFFEVPLIKRRKRFDNYGYLFFPDSGDDCETDVQFVKEKKHSILCVSEKLKVAITKAGLEGCSFEEIK
ncbi:hypothetical protein [Brumimicrobium aurantiacum]|uniref:Uncharacterized protein n=1 Tax=Brumimicrobium aurantiacum TaxID=1737063 RepID=A0A3E1EX84_9FLAO|nr:hypothetical protein [Brumimicrobium aurantiacum]RFC54174.1 hypothetical protein DXU93_09310 [Brumimicrobium aurantiacum]